MRMFKTKLFARFCRQEKIDDLRLLRAVAEIDRGLVDAHLGGSLYKKRIARPGQGKSGGYRTILAFRSKHRAIFIFGFAKNDRDNIDAEELESLRGLGEMALGFDDDEVRNRIDAGSWIEVIEDEGSI